MPAPLEHLPYFFRCGTVPFVPPGPGGLGLSARQCASRRHFRIHLRARRGERLVSARVYVNGHRVRVLRGRRLHAVVNLRGLPPGTFTVRIVARTRTGRVLRSTRVYHTCTARRRAHRRGARHRRRSTH